MLSYWCCHLFIHNSDLHIEKKESYKECPAELSICGAKFLVKVIWLSQTSVAHKHTCWSRFFLKKPQWKIETSVSFYWVGWALGFVGVGTSSMCFNILWLWLFGSRRHSKSNPWLYRCWQVLPFSNNLHGNSDAWHPGKGAAAEPVKFTESGCYPVDLSPGTYTETQGNVMHKSLLSEGSWRKWHFLDEEEASSVSFPSHLPSLS